MIYPIVDFDNIIQVGEMLRINASRSFKTSNEGAFTAVKIKPSAAEAFYDVGILTESQTWYLDWVYSAAGTHLITVRLENALTFAEVTLSVNVVLAADDKLFSTDVDLIGYQHDIMKFLADGRSTWNFVHRVAQTEILAYLDEVGKVNEDGTKITKDQIVDISEVKQLSLFKTLRIIYESMSNASDDFFMKRASHWRKYEESAQLRCVARIDFDKNGTIEDSEVVSNVMIIAGRG